MNQPKIEKKSPSLVINITDKCNFKCKYCPPYGENLIEGKIEYDIEAIKLLIDLMSNDGCKLIRFTGGEPLLCLDTFCELLDYAENRFSRTILNTNGFLLSQNLGKLEKYKECLIIKISLDSLNESEFETISGINGLSKVKQAIEDALNRNFKIEINTVYSTQSIQGLAEIINYAKHLRVDLKILTASNFYGTITENINSINSGKLKEYLDRNCAELSPEKLATGMGASMLTYMNGCSKLFMIDHSNKHSLTPQKMYFSTCKEICNLFPCDFGVLSITIGTDGILTPCRGRKDLGKNIFGKNKSEIQQLYKKVRNFFNNCIEINVNKMEKENMDIKTISDNCDYHAKKEIEEFGLPTVRHYKLSMDYGVELAKKLGANADIVRAGVALMDIKLGQAAKESKQPEHVEISSDYAKELLTTMGVDEKTKQILINCVDAHHGQVPYTSVEAEIVANADCYRFIHPRGVMSFYATVIKRGNEHDAALKAVKAKLEEKHNILSLKEAKSDLEKYYAMFNEILAEGMDN